jgi:hypothetical protein
MERLFFAGEATDFGGYNGTVHGAVESGCRAAQWSGVASSSAPRKPHNDKESSQRKAITAHSRCPKPIISILKYTNGLIRQYLPRGQSMSH